MHWQAIHEDGSVSSGPDGFGFLDFRTIRHFAIVQPLTLGCLVIWEAKSMPIAYGQRNTPNEIVHVIATQRDKVFVFEGTSETVVLTEWGNGIFAPI